MFKKIIYCAVFACCSIKNIICFEDVEMYIKLERILSPNKNERKDIEQLIKKSKVIKNYLIELVRSGKTDYPFTIKEKGPYNYCSRVKFLGGLEKLDDKENVINFIDERFESILYKSSLIEKKPSSSFLKKELRFLAYFLTTILMICSFIAVGLCICFLYNIIEFFQHIKIF